MEKIKSKKESNDTFFSDFQKEFYSKDKNAYNGDVSPTKRLV
jgi:hypothetical protein